MEIDSTTFSDLEIFASHGSGGLFELIDRTATSRGRSALRHRIEHPSSDIDTIRRTQDAIVFLQQHPALFRIDEASLTAVERYLASNIAVDANSRLRDRIEHAWMTFRYRDLLNEIEQGVHATITLCAHTERTCAAIDEHDPPQVIADLTRQLGAMSNVALREHAEAGTTLGSDRAFRAHLRRELDECLALLGELDALNAMAVASSALGWVFPELVDTDAFLLECDGLHHPIVQDAVRNPCTLSGGEPMVFLTGPNMAGKTTYLRAVALVVLLAQAGMAVPARHVRLSPVEALFTSLNPTDNLRAGLSYFYAEIMRVKAAATILAEGRRALVIFDEVFKGTNVRDALDASAEVILGFARARRSGFIFSSHLAELVDVLRSNDAIRFCCFDGEIHDGVPQYSYELMDGVSEKRFGLLLLRQAEVPQLIARISA